MFTSKRAWSLKIADFGSAVETGTILDESVQLNTYWAAPELQERRQPVTMQSDVWSLGVLTFCL